MDVKLPRCNQCLTPPMLWVRIPLIARCPRYNIILCDKVCQWLATGQWFSLDTPVSSTNKTDHHDITEILVKVALNTITVNPNKYWNVKTFQNCFIAQESDKHKIMCFVISAQIFVQRRKSRWGFEEKTRTSWRTEKENGRRKEETTGISECRERM